MCDFKKTCARHVFLSMPTTQKTGRTADDLTRMQSSAKATAICKIQAVESLSDSTAETDIPAHNTETLQQRFSLVLVPRQKIDSNRAVLSENSFPNTSDRPASLAVPKQPQPANSNAWHPLPSTSQPLAVTQSAGADLPPGSFLSLPAEEWPALSIAATKESSTQPQAQLMSAVAAVQAAETASATTALPGICTDSHQSIAA